MTTSYNTVYLAIHEQTKQIFVGARGQAAFSTKGGLKNSMNMQNMYANKGKYDYNDPEWIFYEVDPVNNVLVQVVK